MAVHHCFPAAGTVRSTDERISRLYQKTSQYIEQPRVWEGLFRLACLIGKLPAEEPVADMIRHAISETENGIFVEGSQNQLRQLISVLLDNALSHGTGTVIYLSLKSERHFACLSVANESDPLDDEQLAHIFDRFYRTDEARKGEDSHYGLGLSIAHAVASAHGGQIRADYKNGKAVFTVLIPKK